MTITISENIWGKFLNIKATIEERQKHDICSEYKIKSIKKGIIFGSITLGGNRMNYWKDRTAYIAVDAKTMQMLDTKSEEQTWYSYGRWQQDVINSKIVA